MPWIVRLGLYFDRSNLSKGFDFSTVTETEPDAVVDELNDRPRKRLAKPSEQLVELVFR